MLAVIIFFPLEIMFGFLEKGATLLGNFFFTEISEKPFQSPIKQAVSWGVDHLKHFVKDIINSDWALLAVSVLITLFMLFSIVKLLRSMVLEKVEKFFDQYIFKTAIRALIFGFILTVLVQSSSITTSTIVPLAGAGVVRLHQLYPFTIGANVGTTVTALLASLTLNVTAMVAGFAHLFFNIFGIIIIFLNPLLKNIPLDLADWLSEKAVDNRFLPLLYLIVFFFILPFIFIYFWG